MITNILENRQIGSQHLVELRPVRSVRQFVGNVHAIIGGALFGAGALVFVLQFFFSHHAAVLSLAITGGTLAFVGIVELTIAAFFLGSARRWQTNLARLKSEGHGFPCEVTKVVRNHFVHVGRSVSAYIECTYQNHDGKICLVSSHSFLCDREDYSAWVYVSPYNPMDYAVEVFTQTTPTEINYDYRF